MSLTELISIRGSETLLAELRSVVDIVPQRLMNCVCVANNVLAINVDYKVNLILSRLPLCLLDHHANQRRELNAVRLQLAALKAVNTQ